MKCFTLHVMNIKYMKVWLFEISYKKKITFSRHSNLLRCTCISLQWSDIKYTSFFSLYITRAGWLANISSPVFGLLWAGKIGKLYAGHSCNGLCEPFIFIVFIHVWPKCLCSIYRITFSRWVAFSVVYFKLWAYFPISCFLCLSIFLYMYTNYICSSFSWMLVA